jgi:DNA-binding CsgD family transcriptional regulator
MPVRKRREHQFAEVVFERLSLENMARERSAYYESEEESRRREVMLKLEPKLKWHIRNSLSRRQREVIRLILKGKTEREIAAILGITQQVVHIYKHRAIKKLRDKIDWPGVCQTTN